MKTILIYRATVKSGHPFPKRIEESENGDVGVIQMKDLPNAFQLTTASPVHINTDEIKERYLLEADDIIFRSRGQTNTCILLKTDLGPVVAAAPLMTLRVTSESLLPDYLCWWINQQPAQTHFNRHARGTAGRMISRDALEDLEINVPPLTIQKQIVELALLGEREQELLTRLAEAEKRKLHCILIKTATEEK
jgi:restriction endonuclease S subunit